MKKISFSPPDIGEEEIAAVGETLRSGWITTGPKTKEFERQLAAFCQTEKAVCLNSQTAAAETTLRLLGIGEGDEVITTPYTYTASASVLCHVGAKPVFVDTAPGSFFMDMAAVEKAITPKTKAILPVDLGGVMCDYDTLFSIAQEKRSLFTPKNDLQKAFGRVIILADAAHSLGAERNGKVSGSAADFSCFSFHAVKNLTTGEGGAVTWNKIPGVDSEEIYKQYMLLSLHGQSKDALQKNQLGAWEYDIIEPFYKCNMTDIMASIGLVQLHRYPSLLSRRKTICRQYYEGLWNLPVTTLRHYGEDFSSSGHLYMVHLNEGDEGYRNQVITRMAQRGIACNVHYKPLPMLSAYHKRGYSMDDYPNAYHMYKGEITLPLHTLLSDEDVAYIVASFQESLRG